MLIDRANLMLDAWDDGLITDEAVRSWAALTLPPSSWNGCVTGRPGHCIHGGCT